MDKPTLDALKVLEAAKAAMTEALRRAVDEYANGGNRAKPIVDEHFTAGNNQRYGWAPLSQAYAKQKAKQAGALRKGMKEAGRVVSKLDPNVPFQSSTGTMTGMGTGSNLPTLVRSGALRESVNSRQHKVEVNATVGTVTVVFLVLDYGKYHHTGTGKLPKRSPVEPGARDIEQIRNATNRHLSALVGRRATVSVSTEIPGTARIQ